MKARAKALALVGAMVATLAAAAGGRAQPAPAPAPAGADSLRLFLERMADTTGLYFGGAAAEFDTAGLDSVARMGGLAEAGGGARGRRGGEIRLEVTKPVIRFNRAEGPVLGFGVAQRSYALGSLEAHGAYGFASEEARYAFLWKRMVWADRSGFRDAERRRRWHRGRTLELEAGYRRETLPFAPEHGQALAGSVTALFTGGDRQDFYERRGPSLELRLAAPGWAVGAGWRHARDQAMRRETRFSLLGPDGRVAPVTPAAGAEYAEWFGGGRWERAASLFAAAGSVHAWEGGDWRARAALAKGQRMGRDWLARLQLEAGAAPAGVLPQRGFQLGGPLAVPALRHGDAGGDHLLLAKLELASGNPSLANLGLPLPDFLYLEPALFAQSGAAWSEPDGALVAAPPRAAWRSCAGLALHYRLGMPDEDSTWRFQVAWPLGPGSGETRFSLAVGRGFDLFP